MRLLHDENVPHDLIPQLAGHNVSTVQGLGWAGIKNGELLERARDAIDVFVTMDRCRPCHPIRGRHRLPGKRIDRNPENAEQCLPRAGGDGVGHTVNARQATQLAALYAEDAVSMPFNRPNLVGRQALQADFEMFFGDNGQVRHETFVDEVLVAVEWGIERARYTLTYTPKEGGRTVVETGRHVICRKLIDGRWQIVWEIFNTDQSAG